MTIVVCGESYVQTEGGDSLGPGVWLMAAYRGRNRSKRGLRIESFDVDGRLLLNGNPMAYGWSAGDDLIYWHEPDEAAAARVPAMDLESTTKLITHLRAMGVRSFKDPTTGLEVVFDREGPAERPGPNWLDSARATAAANPPSGTWGTWGPEEKP